MRFTQLADWLAWQEQLHDKPIDLGLDRIRQVAHKAAIKLPSQATIITVAGTNGKGSTVGLLEAIALAADYQVGTYTSPHLLHYNERIKINGYCVTDEQLCQAFNIIDQARGGTTLSFFEFGTLAALVIFSQFALDLIVLEVGLGGRLDAVNIVDSDIAVLTSIDLDHQDWLGNTRDLIGYEKAGIFRANKYAICGDPNIPDSVKKYAEQLNVQLLCVNQDFTWEIKTSVWQWRSLKTCYQDLPIPKILLDNAATSLQAIELLQDRLPISLAAIKQGLRSVSIPGRFQVIVKSLGKLVLDVAHNPAAAIRLAQAIAIYAQPSRVIAVVGMLRDKDIAGTLIPLIPYVREWHVASLSVKRGASAANLAIILGQHTGTPIYQHANVEHAYAAAVQSVMVKEDIILVFGSFYTVADVLCLEQ